MTLHRRRQAGSDQLPRNKRRMLTAAGEGVVATRRSAAMDARSVRRCVPNRRRLPIYPGRLGTSDDDRPAFILFVALQRTASDQASPALEFRIAHLPRNEDPVIRCRCEVFAARQKNKVVATGAAKERKTGGDTIRSRRLSSIRRDKSARRPTMQDLERRRQPNGSAERSVAASCAFRRAEAAEGLGRLRQ